MNKYLITIIGPTAIGKTNLSIKLAKYFHTEILSSDSRQFYKEMCIGTAVPSKEELASVPHHFIQNKSIFEDYSVGQFEKEALNKLNEFYQNSNVAILAGGSGLYTNAILYGLDDFPEVNPEIRAELNNIFETKGLLPLQIQLKELDLETYNSIKIDNPRRVIRALEICLSTGNKFSFYKNKPKAKRNFIPIIIGLEAEREIIYKRINKRVDLMINNGLLHEAKKLYPNKNLNALQTVGYQELFNFFDGKYSLEFAINEIKKNTRRFAKRQITWNKKYQDIQLFNYAVPHKEIIQFLEGKMKND